MSVQRFGLMLTIVALAGAVAPVASSEAMTPRVIGGAPVSAPAFMGLLVGEAGRNIQFCGGEAVAPHVFLTAAHCVFDESGNPLSPDSFRIVFGQDDPWLAPGDPTIEQTRVTQVVTAAYRRLSNGLAVNDVALLQLQTPAPGTVRLATSSMPQLSRTGRVAAVMGWGRVSGLVADSLSPLLLQTRLRVQRSSVCTARAMGFDAGSMLCMYSGATSDCNGDSGGPLLSSSGGVRYLIGIVSTGDLHCSVGVPSIFTKVSSGPLASFTATQVPLLEQAAEAQPPAVPVATVPVPTTTTTPAPVLSLSAAKATATDFGRRYYHWTKVAARCSRVTSLRIGCRIYGRRHGRWWMARRELALSLAGIVIS
jgi:secreted trypsin-like serine protease